MKRICVHGHFYQPPRENPWLESIEPQDSAAPYHDWNERVAAESYEPNTASRILDADGSIVAIVNNYARMSFDFGPTLLSWLQESEPSVYRAILRADEESRERFSGHGSAMAQSYNHTILPLATAPSKRIQVAWGIRDFEARFGRRPEGMWLPETAVDLASLESLAEHDIAFTVLAPSQAARVRPHGADTWKDVRGGRIDTRRPYTQHLPSGRSIAVFFYDGELSRGVAFEGLLHRGEAFATRLAEAASDEDGTLTHIATDGESYGHHHPHGDMALAYALRALEERDMTQLTNYGEFLEQFPPVDEVEILERTAWSCAHGVDRWRRDCGCHTGGPPEWSQAWREPLRTALDALASRADAVSLPYRRSAFHDPAAAADAYIDIIHDRRPSNIASFMAHHAKGSPDPEGVVHALKLLELTRQMELAFTSCGWFFNDLAGIETVQILRYAARAIQLAEDISGESLEQDFIVRLEQAHSNDVLEGSGRDLYTRTVRPSKVTWEMLAAHYAIDAFFETGPDKASIYCYDIAGERDTIRTLGSTRVASGRARMTSRITRATETMSFVVLHPGGHRILVGVERGASSFSQLLDRLSETDESRAPDLLAAHFGTHVYTLDSLFGDEKRRIVGTLLASSLDDAEASLGRLADEHGPTIRFLAELGVPTPQVLAVAVGVVANAKLKRALEGNEVSTTMVLELVDEAKGLDVALDESDLSFRLRRSLVRAARDFFERPTDLKCLERLDAGVELALAVPFEVDLWQVQNLYFRASREHPSRGGEDDARTRAFARLGERLSISPGRASELPSRA